MMIIPALLILSSSGKLSPVNLTCEYLVNPIGIDQLAPRLSWIDRSSRRGAAQTAYRIQVSSNPSVDSADLWDSGRVDCSATSLLPYEGKPLNPGQRAFWKVQVWDEKNHASSSQISYWEIGLPKTSDWHASWISELNSPSDPLQIRAPYFRKSFQISKKIRSARVYASAKGLYKLFLNGRKVGSAELTPGWTDYRKRVQYETYDVTHLLRTGENAVGMVVGNGWYCGHVGLTGGSNYGDYPEAIAQFRIEFIDGSVQESSTDHSWKVNDGPLVSNDLLMGESYDARKELGGWSNPGYNDSSWRAVQTKPVGVIPLVADEAPPIQTIVELKPKAMIPQKQAGTYVFDLGQNMVGWTRLKVAGPAGTQVQLRFAEMLSPDRSVYTANLRGARATDHYTLKGQGTEVFEPSFTSHGFRYIEVTGYPGVPTKDAITGIVVGSNNPQTGTFQSSNALVNQLQHNIVWGQRGNYLSIPTDCPQRDERLGWMGDAQIFVRTATFNSQVAAFMTKWTQDVEDAQSEAGGFSDVSPRMGDQSDGAPAWGDAGVIVPWTIYRCYGDKQILERRYDSMRRWIEYIDSVNPNHIWIKRSNNNFGDWLNDHDDTPRDVIATAYFAYSTSLVAKTARILGKLEDATHYEALANQIKAAFREQFVSSDGKIKGDTQTDYVLALHFGLLRDDQRHDAAERLIKHIVIDRKNHLSTGFVGVGYLNPTLNDIGRSDVAYKLLLNDTYPSWGYSIRQGATTIWERWDGWTEKNGFQDPGMNSFNHYSLGSVGEWMYDRIAGIDLDPEVPGYEKFVIRPTLGGGLTWAKGSLDSIHGRIESSWKQDRSHLSLQVQIPANTTATIYIPTADPAQVKEGHRLASLSSDLTFVRNEPGYAVFLAKSGRYHFTSVVN